MPKGKVVSMGFLPLIHPPRNFVGYHGFLSLTKVLSVTEKCNKQRACGVMHWRRNLDKTAAFLLLKVLKFQVKRVFGPVLNVKCKTGLASDQNIWQSLFYNPVDKRVAQYPKIRTTSHILLLPTFNILQYPTTRSTPNKLPSFKVPPCAYPLDTVKPHPDLKQSW